MDSFEPEKANRILWKRSKSELDENNGTNEEGDKRRHCDSLQLCTFSSTSSEAQKFMMPLLPISKVEEWCPNSSTVFTGTACRGGIGPPVGTVDIGVSKSAYYFCVALPGVKKDPGEFSCEINRDGEVCVRGVTSTGGKTVMKYSRVFEMKYQQQCSPGPFTLFFSLPGPVDPRLFSPNFRSDGIFEGVVAKFEQ